MNKAKHAIARVSMAAALFATAPLVSAAEYVVQIGAFKFPPSSTISSLGSYGEILEESTAGGLTRILVGTFGSHGEATGIRDQLRDQGYPDAFVTRFGGQSSYAASNSISDDYGSEDNDYSAAVDTQNAYAAAKSAAPAAGGNSSMSGLSEEEKLRAVFLDGQLKLKVGDEFLTLDEYRARY